MSNLVAEGDDMLPVDILVHPGHIAFAIVNTPEKYSTVSDYAIARQRVQFMVNYGKIHSEHLQKCIRLSPSTLPNRKTTV
jgi:hypothetical protein